MKRILTVLLILFNITAVFAQTTYTISQVGAITDFKVFNDIGGTSFCGTNTSLAVNKDFAPQITGYIDQMGMLNTGDRVTIQLTSDPASTYAATTAVLPTVIKDLSGVDVFTVSKSGSTIILTRTANAFPGGRIDFTIFTSRQNVAMTRVGTFSSWWVAGYENLACTFTNSPKAYSNSSGYFINDTGGSYVCTRSIGVNVYLFGVYNTLLANIAAGMDNEAIKADLLGKYPWLNQDHVVYIHIEANPNILSINYFDYYNILYDLRADGSGISSAFSNNGYFTSNLSLMKANLSADLSYNSALTALQPGEYGIVQNTDGSYTIVINYGKLLGDTYAGYPAGYNMGNLLRMVETPEIIALQEQLLGVAQAINLASENFFPRWLISFADCSTLGQVCYTVQSNLLKWNTTAGADVSPLRCQSSGTPPSSGAEPEQTQITVHYVNKQGYPLSNTTVSVGYPPDNTSGHQSTILHTVPAPLIGYVPVTDPAVLATVAGILGVNDSQMLSNASGGDLYYPSGSVNSGILHVYYVYEPWTALINPHIRQRVGS
jgi:hypothetical protein